MKNEFDNMANSNGFVLFDKALLMMILFLKGVYLWL